jgi:hypothetical protein
VKSEPQLLTEEEEAEYRGHNKETVEIEGFKSRTHENDAGAEKETMGTEGNRETWFQQT